VAAIVIWTVRNLETQVVMAVETRTTDRKQADAERVADRVDFRSADAGSYRGTGYDLICFFDALHELGDAVAAARQAHEALADDGTLTVESPFNIVLEVRR
jgi:hypothetical protein